MSNVTSWTVRTLVGGAFAGALALATVAPASATVYEYSGHSGSHTYGSTSVVWTSSNSNKKINMVVNGSGSGMVRAQCTRANGGTKWYQSTIEASHGGNSHYDCGNNSTYDHALAGYGIDL
ncbi:hypothetical protein ACIGXA_24035 [Streptomyces fildesensis]|uniref:Uncharacterized protein n=1 Tax=Streptomyces fildesensis TaxID=375757 RepID=A0ABW8CAY8_9ACTN